MKKRKFVIFSLLIVLLLSFSGFQYYKYQRVDNIFDEIYYEESDYHNYTFLWKGRAFYKLKSLKLWTMALMSCIDMLLIIKV